MTTNEMMLAIKNLDPSAYLEFSDCTLKWYVTGSIDIADGRFLTGITEHRGMPTEAIEAFFTRLAKVQSPDCLRAKDQQHYRWRGFMWEHVHAAAEHRGECEP